MTIYSLDVLLSPFGKYVSIFSFKFLSLSLMAILNALYIVSNTWIIAVFVLLNAFSVDYILHFFVFLMYQFLLHVRHVY